MIVKKDVQDPSFLSGADGDYGISEKIVTLFQGMQLTEAEVEIYLAWGFKELIGVEAPESSKRIAKIVKEEEKNDEKSILSLYETLQKHNKQLENFFQEVLRIRKIERGTLAKGEKLPSHKLDVRFVFTIMEELMEMIRSHYRLYAVTVSLWVSVTKTFDAHLYAGFFYFLSMYHFLSVDQYQKQFLSYFLLHFGIYLAHMEEGGIPRNEVVSQYTQGRVIVNGIQFVGKYVDIDEDTIEVFRKGIRHFFGGEGMDQRLTEYQLAIEIARIVDEYVYALYSRRSRGRFCEHDSMQRIQRNTHYEHRLKVLFNLILSDYPLGSLLLVENNLVALVSGLTKDPHNPLVKVMVDAYSGPLKEFKEELLSEVHLHSVMVGDSFREIVWKQLTGDEKG